MRRLCARAGNRSTMTFLRRHAVCRVNTAAADAKSSLQGSTIRCTVVLQQKCDNATLIIFISTTTTNRLKNQQRHRVTSQQWLGHCPALQSVGVWLITASDRIGHSNQIKSNQIFFCSRRCKIAQYKEPIQSLEQGHKGLEKATYLYPKIMQKKLKTHITKIPVKIEQQT